MIHIYCGDGKGKTTAACGLALRASGSGMKVLFAQFFKGGGSSELNAMSKLENIDILNADRHYGRYKTLSDAEKSETVESYARLYGEIEKRAGEYDMLVLDEAVSAYNYAMLNGGKFLDFLRREGQNREIVLTGRDPSPELLELGDYITEMRNLKHPYQSGVKARKGIEY